MASNFPSVHRLGNLMPFRKCISIIDFLMMRTHLGRWAGRDRKSIYFHCEKVANKKLNVVLAQQREYENQTGDKLYRFTFLLIFLSVAEARGEPKQGKSFSERIQQWHFL